MVQLRFPNFKSGFNPSKKTAFDPNNLTPSQKILLVRNRIWGNIIGGSVRSGFKELASPVKGRAIMDWYDQSHLKDIYPFIKDWEKINNNKKKYEDRKLRIYMRGVKIGTKKEGRLKEGMNMFQMQKKQIKDEMVAKEDLKKLKDEELGMF